jgi:hypothetical protein
MKKNKVRIQAKNTNNSQKQNKKKINKRSPNQRNLPRGEKLKWGGTPKDTSQPAPKTSIMISHIHFSLTYSTHVKSYLSLIKGVGTTRHRLNYIGFFN